MAEQAETHVNAYQRDLDDALEAQRQADGRVEAAKQALRDKTGKPLPDDPKPEKKAAKKSAKKSAPKAKAANVSGSTGPKTLDNPKDEGKK